MKLPTHLKNLYRHWPLHTTEQAKTCVGEIPEEICRFIEERMHIWEKKTVGLPRPYTDDPILSKYRFCNILRELDRQTIEFHTLLNPLRDDFPLWLLNMFYCRMVARPETIKTVGLLSYNQKTNELFYKKFIASPRPRFGTPYVFPVSTILKSKTPTRELFITRYLPNITLKIADEIQTWEKKSVYDGVNILLPIFGYNLSFLWTEVLIDVAYQFPQYLDLFKQFPIGPGSMPTIKKLSDDKEPSTIVAELATFGITVDLSYEQKPILLSAENWEGIGCEFRKYSNLKRGEGRKRLYR